MAALQVRDEQPLEGVQPADAPRLARALAQPRAYSPAPAEVVHLETHISHVFLTGTWAYKIKKPLDLGFLDFSTLEKRRRCCLDELRINRRLAPELYADVVPITGSVDRPAVEGAGTPIEYAVKMRQFSQEGMLEQVLARGELTPALIDGIADQVAQFHTRLPPAGPDTKFGTPHSVMAPARQNFEQFADVPEAAVDRSVLAALREWTETQHTALESQFLRRKQEGFVRECHGDLHLGNMVLVDGRVRIFDAIEFNEQLRWIDVISEVAFLGMDLEQRRRGDLAWRFLDAYLQRTGDYNGVRLLRYYMVYRAVVRAKVAAIRATQAELPAAQRTALAEKCRSHLAWAHRFATQMRPALIVHFGLSGSGKTTASQVILEHLGAIRVRSDVERKRLQGLAATARTGAAVGAGIYSADANRATYARLAEAAQDVVRGGCIALVDATFMRRADRAAFRELAGRLGVPFGIAQFTASPQTLRSRVLRREQESRDASEAGIAVLEHQLRTCEPLSAEELAVAATFDTERMDHEQIRNESRRMLARLAGNAQGDD
jgi:aminoglycoside phosphotransferase family enzyme/predicted kinase